MAVITMSRQIGSGAMEVADRLREELGLVPFDRRLMAQVASEVGLSDSELVDYSEDSYKLRSFFDALLRRSRPVAEVSSWTGGRDSYERQVNVLDEKQAVSLVRSIVVAAYERDNVLIIGRGGQAILEDKPGVLHIRIVAPFEQRVQSLQAEQNLTAAQARRLITEHDHATAEYLRTFHHVDVDDPTLYHLVLNAGKLGVNKCVALIKAAVQQALDETSDAAIA